MKRASIVALVLLAGCASAPAGPPAEWTQCAEMHSALYLQGSAGDLEFVERYLAPRVAEQCGFGGMSTREAAEALADIVARMAADPEELRKAMPGAQMEGELEALLKEMLETETEGD